MFTVCAVRVVHTRTNERTIYYNIVCACVYSERTSARLESEMAARYYTLNILYIKIRTYGKLGKKNCRRRCTLTVHNPSTRQRAGRTTPFPPTNTDFDEIRLFIKR